MYSPVRIYDIRSVGSTLHSKHYLIIEEIIFIMNTDSIKGQARCIQTLVQVEAPSLETSKFSLYFQVVLSQSIRSFRTYFPQNFELFSIDFSVKMYHIFDEKF